jgi:hypothetical protein
LVKESPKSAECVNMCFRGGESRAYLFMQYSERPGADCLC